MLESNEYNFRNCNTELAKHTKPAERELKRFKDFSYNLIAPLTLPLSLSLSHLHCRYCARLSLGIHQKYCSRIHYRFGECLYHYFYWFFSCPQHTHTSSLHSDVFREWIYVLFFHSLVAFTFSCWHFGCAQNRQFRYSKKKNEGTKSNRKDDYRTRFRIKSNLTNTFLSFHFFLFLSLSIYLTPSHCISMCLCCVLYILFVSVGIFLCVLFLLVVCVCVCVYMPSHPSTIVCNRFNSKY